jgi:hypothetical protein
MAPSTIPAKLHERRLSLHSEESSEIPRDASGIALRQLNKPNLTVHERLHLHAFLQFSD